jgi:hypothetical protein
MSADDLRGRYREIVGRDPAELPPDHPDRWQWEYRGSRDERAALLERLSGEERAAVEQEPLPGIAA